MKFILRKTGTEDRECGIESLGEGRYEIRLDGESFTVESRPLGQGGYSLLDGQGRSFEAWVHTDGEPSRRRVWLHDSSYRFNLLSPVAALLHDGPAATGGAVASPMPGRLVKLLVGEGDTVLAGQPLCVVEAMKMQNELAAPGAGRVRAIHFKAGDQVPAGAAILTLDSFPAPG
jgi:biotin carboxyl carrier protein